jgi:hypothetical protein
MEAIEHHFWLASFCGRVEKMPIQNSKVEEMPMSACTKH